MKQILNGCVFPVRSNDFLITTNSQETKKWIYQSLFIIFESSDFNFFKSDYEWISLMLQTDAKFQISYIWECYNQRDNSKFEWNSLLLCYFCFTEFRNVSINLFNLTASNTANNCELYLRMIIIIYLQLQQNW